MQAWISVVSSSLYFWKSVFSLKWKFPDCVHFFGAWARQVVIETIAVVYELTKRTQEKLFADWAQQYKAIFVPNQQPASAWIFGNSSVRVSTQGLVRPCLKTFVPPFLPTRLTAPGSPRMRQSKILDSTPWILDSGTWILDSAPWIPDSLSVILGFRIPSPGFRFHKKKFPRFRNTDSLAWGDWFFGLRWTVPIYIYIQHKWRVWFYNFFHLYFDRKHRPSWGWMAWKRVSRLYKHLKFKYKSHAT